MILSEAIIGNSYAVSGISLDLGTMRRLEALGLTNQTVIKILNRNRTNSIILMVRGTRLALGKNIAKSIEISEI